MSENQLEEKMMSLKEYAKTKGISYEAIRAQLDRYKDDQELMSHIHKVGRTRYIDEEGQKLLDRRRNAPPTVVISADKASKIDELKLKLVETEAERDKERTEKELYMRQVIELQNKGIDETKYMLIEDHRKTEEELKAKEQEIEDLKKVQAKESEKKKQLEENYEVVKKEKEDLQSAAIKTAHLVSDINGKLSKLEEEKKNLEDIKHQIEEEKEQNRQQNEELQKKLDAEEEARKAEEKARINAEQQAEEAKRAEEEAKVKAAKDLEETKKKAEEESIELLQLGFFARRKKLKELKAKKSSSSEPTE